MDFMQQSDDSDFQAAKQLRAELHLIKNTVYSQHSKLTPITIIKIKHALRGLMTRYQNNGFFDKEHITLKLSNRSAYPNISFVYSQKLHIIMKSVDEHIATLIKEKAEQKEVVSTT